MREEIPHFLYDLEKNLINALNEAMKEAEKSSKKIMSEVTGGLNIPGL